MSNKLDDILSEFEEKTKDAVSSYRPLWEGDTQDNFYNVDIHIWRKPGMGNSLQTIAGNKISIMTATSSFLNTLLSKGVISEEELIYMIKLVLENNSVSNNK